jgi:dihydroorotate dehydrogenase (fumarate)
MRYMGLLSGQVKGSLCANTGFLEGKDIVAALLAGAHAVQVVSAIYKNGTKDISRMLDEITDWMQKKGYNSLADFQGKMSKENLKEPHAYTRAQYVDFLMKAKEYINKYPVN